jgi:hypothetical protein
LGVLPGRIEKMGKLFIEQPPTAKFCSMVMERGLEVRIILQLT